jgi:hypothetical protein
VIQTAAVARRKWVKEKDKPQRLEDREEAIALAFHAYGTAFFEVFGSLRFVSPASV